MSQPNHPRLEAVAPHIPFPSSGSYRIGEAIDVAQSSVWLTVAFFAPDFRMPDGRGSLFDVLDRAVARGLDVRVIFWRPNRESSGLGRTFPGSPADHDMLRARGSHFRARWDRAQGPYLQHQKSWLVDAGEPSEVAFIGGINLTAQAMGSPGHSEGHRHDVYVELSGPAATDVHHNFVQRWNEASERASDDGRWGHDEDDQLAFPVRLSEPRGPALVQIQRNVHPGRYSNGHPSPGAAPYYIAGGERTIFDQYVQAIGAARQAIYIENQAIPIPPIAAGLAQALERGVDVVVLVPAEPEAHVRRARRDPERRTLFDQIAALDRYDHFALVGIAAKDLRGERRDIYVHAKIMLVDDSWATIGSCNLHTNSLSGHTELNASFWDPMVVRALRCALLEEHLGLDTARLDARSAHRLYREIAGKNRQRRDAGRHDWQGLAYRLDPWTYGEC
jgi:phosphatidylserine/phosphatidylglycerophosphate/cardiolipin synthase-like enzyme